MSTPSLLLMSIFESLLAYLYLDIYRMYLLIYTLNPEYLYLYVCIFISISKAEADKETDVKKIYVHVWQTKRHMRQM